MSDALFNDNLYGYSPALRRRGAGLFGSCATTARFLYKRHADECKAGMWRIALAVEGVRDADCWGVIGSGESAVVDDFGSLVRVQ